MYRCLKSYEGSATATGVVPLELGGLPAHLKSGQSPAGYSTRDNIMSHKTPIKTLAVSGGVGTVKLQACEGDPSVSADWYDVGSITDEGELTDNNVRKWTRVNVTAYTSGTYAIDYTLSD